MTAQHHPGTRPSSDGWVAAIHQGSEGAWPLGSGVLIDGRRVLTCAHVVYVAGQVRDGLWVTLPKAEELMFERLQVREVFAPPPEKQEIQDVALLVLEKEVGARHAAPLHNPPASALVHSAWWSFGFPDGVLGDSAEGEVSEALALGWARLRTHSPSLVRPGYSGAGLWSARYEAVVGLVGQAHQGSGDARALTLKLIDRWLPQARLDLLPGWSSPLAEQAEAPSWGWRLAQDAEAVRHWRPRARGVSTDAEQGFRFRGRHAALTRVIDWLTAPDADRRRVLLVTGSPGVGKSAVLGRVVTTADADIAASLPGDDEAPCAELGSVACAVHARDKTALEVAAEIARAASAPAPKQAKELPDQLRGALEKDDRGRFNVVIDAVDEAASPEQARLIMQTAIAVAETCADLNVRLVVGSRRTDEAGELLASFASALTIIDLDWPEFFAQEDLVAYALATLQLVGAERLDSPYRDTRVATALAHRIADMAQGNFLIAGLVARSHGLHDDVAVEAKELRYTSTVETALREYLSRLQGVQEVSAQALLTPLAYADSPGLTLPLWQAVIRAMTGTTVATQLLYRFARSAAANFLVESSDDSSSLGSFRLFHQALNEALRQHRATLASPRHDERAIARALMQEAGGRWEQAAQYALRSLPGHAARGGIMDELLQDDTYPLYADLRRLVPAAQAAHSPPARARARLLRKTPQALTAPPAERAALLSVTEAREQLGVSYRQLKEPTLYRAVWAIGAPHAEDIVLEGHTGWVNALCAVPGDQHTLLASASNDGTVRLWNTETGETVRVLAGHTGPVRALACCGGGHRLLASAGSDHSIRLWHPLTGTTVRELTGHSAVLNALCAVPAGAHTLLASAGNDGTIRLWNTETGQTVGVLAGHGGPVRALASVTVDAQVLLASAGTDGTIRLWDAATGRQMRTLPAGEAWINALCPLPLGPRTLLASAGNEPTVRVWDPATGELTHTLGQHSDWVRALAPLPLAGRTVLASAGHDNAVRLWDPAPSGSSLPDGLAGHTDWVTSLCVVDGAQQLLLASAGNDSAIRMWDVHAQPPQPRGDDGTTVTGLTALPASVASSVTIAVAVGDAMIQVRQAASGEIVRQLRGQDAWVRTLCVVAQADQHHLATGGEDGDLQLFELTDDTRMVRTWRAHEEAVVAVRPVRVEGTALLVSASSDQTIRLWDPQHSARRIAQAVWESPVAAMDVVAVGERQVLAIGLEDGSVGLWDPRSERTVALWDGHNGAVTALTALRLPHQTLLASAGEDGSIQLWDTDSRQPVHSLTGHTDKITTLTAYTHHQQPQLISASEDRTVRVWDARSGQATMTIAVHSPASALADCGTQLVVGLSDGLIALAFSEEN